MKIRFNIGFNSTEIVVNVMSVCRKKHIVYQNTILESCVCLAIKFKCKHKSMFLTMLFETC